MSPKKLLNRIARGHVANVRFGDLLRLTAALGFVTNRVAGSHHILVHARVQEPLNLQNVGGEAKPYQVRQVLRIIGRYNLRLENDE